MSRAICDRRNELGGSDRCHKRFGDRALGWREPFEQGLFEGIEGKIAIMPGMQEDRSPGEVCTDLIPAMLGRFSDSDRARRDPLFPPRSSECCPSKDDEMKRERFSEL